LASRAKSAPTARSFREYTNYTLGWKITEVQAMLRNWVLKLTIMSESDDVILDGKILEIDLKASVFPTKVCG